MIQMHYEHVKSHQFLIVFKWSKNLASRTDFFSLKGWKWTKRCEFNHGDWVEWVIGREWLENRGLFRRKQEIFITRFKDKWNITFVLVQHQIAIKQQDRLACLGLELVKTLLSKSVFTNFKYSYHHISSLLFRHQLGTLI